MGILGLSKLIADVAPGAIKENEMKNYFGRKVAIDASMSLYQVYYFSKFLSQRFCTRSPRYSSSFILRYVSQIDDLQYIKDVAYRGVTDWYRYIDSYINSNSKLNESFHFGNWNIFFCLNFQFLIAVRTEGAQLTSADGETTSHIMGTFYRTIRMVDNGIKPVYVFDGKVYSSAFDSAGTIIKSIFV